MLPTLPAAFRGGESLCIDTLCIFVSKRPHRTETLQLVDRIYPFFSLGDGFTMEFFEMPLNIKVVHKIYSTCTNLQGTNSDNGKNCRRQGRTYKSVKHCILCSLDVHFHHHKIILREPPLQEIRKVYGLVRSGVHLIKLIN